MKEKLWPTVVGTALVTLAVLLVGSAVVYLGASTLSAEPSGASSLALFFVLPVVMAATALGGAMALFSRGRGEHRGKYVALGLAIAVLLVFCLMFIAPELSGPRG